MTKKLALVSRNPAIKPSDWKPAEPTHLDIALAHGYLLDVLAITLSVRDRVSPHDFHLALKATLSGEHRSLWINVFGPREYLAGRAVEAIDAVLTVAPSQRLAELQRWKAALADFSWRSEQLLLLPG